jgi:alpha-beta hydrolase superfamily lysophospholipase
MPAPSIETFSASDGYQLRYRRFLPEKDTRPAHVVCIHGIQSHGGWYEHSCKRLAERGFRVDFLDRRGSGLNQQDRGDTPGFRRLLDDLAEFLRTCRTGSDRLFLVAVSWGGKLAAALQRHHPGLVDGLVLVSPGFRAQVRPSLKERLRILWARLIAPRRLFPIPLNDPELFTGNPVKRQFIRDDPLALREATARLLVESARLDGYLRFASKYVTVPVLLMLAEHDRIIHNERTRRLFEKFASAEKEVIEYPGAHHTLEFEPDPEPYIRDLGNWLEKHS